MARAQKAPPLRGIALGRTALEVFTGTPQAVRVMDGFSVVPNGLLVEGEPTFDQCMQLSRLLPVTERAIQFAIGDFINYLEERFGEQASQIVDYSDGWSESTCTVYAWLAKRITAERRRMDRLTIGHHLAVAALSPSKQTHWLTKAAADGEPKPWTVQRLKAAITDVQDLPETFWVMVSAASVEDQEALREQLEAQGRSCKALVRRQRRACVES